MDDAKTDTSKTFNDALRAAFERGLAVGARYPEVDAIPNGEADVQFEAFKAQWRGDDVWSSREWFDRRKAAGLVNAYPPAGRIEEDPDDMGHHSGLGDY